MRKLIQLGILAFLAASAAASDSAVLRNGFSILYQHRQISGANTRLFLNQDPANFVDIPTAEIDHFENVPDAPIVKASRAADTAPPFDLNETVKAASGTYRLDPDLVTSVIRAESGFNVRAVSPKGAQGLMQLMPRTASHLGVEDAFDPQANVEGGTKYLRELLERYNFDLIKALAAYNAGPQRVEQYNGVPPYQETRAYVARIVRDFNKKKLAAKSGSEVSTTSHSSPPTEKTSLIKPAKAKAPTSSTQSPGQN